MINYEEIKHCIALTLVKGVGLKLANKLIDYAGSAINVFRSLEYTRLVYLVGPNIASEMRKQIYLDRAEEIISESDRRNVQLIVKSSKEYPNRLLECIDAPLVLFSYGNINLNVPRVISIVGTRNITSYGKDVVQNLIRELSQFDKNIIIVSGLAYGVDITSHRAALECDMPTVGILAHGLDRVYPSLHRDVASRMTVKGGLLTEFPFNTFPERYNFVSRNRIIAGLSDATIVVESASKGGSLITADFANNYNRECFAVPGRIDSSYSMGCNRLIANHQASIVLSASDIIENLNWDIPHEPTLFDDIEMNSSKDKTLDLSSLDENEQRVVRCLQRVTSLTLDEISQGTNIAIIDLHAILFKLEMSNFVVSIAGNAYKLV